MTANNNKRTQDNHQAEDVDDLRGSQNNTSNSNKDFASIDAEKQREFVRKGGRTADESENDSEEAREAERKGGQPSHQVTDGSSSNKNR